MKKIIIFLAAMTLVAFAYMSSSVLAGGMKDPMGKTHKEVSQLIGKEVKNMEGEHLGTVRDFVKDSEGRISFVIVAYGGFIGLGEKRVAIPYSALTYNAETQHYSCAVSRDRFAAAPEFESAEKLRDLSSAEEIYRYFGQRPYWSEESMGTGGTEY
jgi:sporulation protein YlmC with PRC-barrel domain